MDDIARELLMRDHIEVVLIVDVETARDLDDETLERVLGEAAREQVRVHQEDGDAD